VKHRKPEPELRYYRILYDEWTGEYWVRRKSLRMFGDQARRQYREIEALGNVRNVVISPC